jgi:hypothetical protein
MSFKDDFSCDTFGSLLKNPEISSIKEITKVKKHAD